MKSTRRWYQRIGPGLITACVVIGPGSILTSSNVGATYGYSMNWVVIVAVAFMMTYVLLGAKLGMVAKESPGTLIAQNGGRPLAVVLGLAVFFISALFQYGNNLGVHYAFAVYYDFPYTVVIFNALAIAFLFAFKNFYKAIERLMMVFVGLMLLSFALNLIVARPNLLELAGGFIPSANSDVNWSLLGLVGTTFVISAAYLQAYLVRQKGWAKNDVQEALIDSRVSGVIMALITLMIISTSAAVLRGKTLENVVAVANQLQPLFGGWGRLIFCFGLFSAAYSSFLVNSMIGGFILSDGLGLGSEPRDRWPRLMTVAVLLTGMGVALLVINTKFNAVGAIVAAQALTVLAAPLTAGVMLWLTNLRSVMGDERNGAVINVVAGLGFAMLLAIAGYTAVAKVWPAIEPWVLQILGLSSETP